MTRRQGVNKLSRAAIVQAALRIVDEQGLASLTMRKLGAALGVDAMAVYYYIPNKKALLRALVEHVFADFSPQPATTWQDQVRAWAKAYRALARQHPNLVLQIVTDQETVAVATRLANPSLHAAIQAAGLPASYQQAAADTVVDYVNGFVLAEATMRDGAAAAFAQGLDILLAGLERLAEAGPPLSPSPHRKRCASQSPPLAVTDNRPDSSE